MSKGYRICQRDTDNCTDLSEGEMGLIVEGLGLVDRRDGTSVSENILRNEIKRMVRRSNSKKYQ